MHRRVHGVCGTCWGRHGHIDVERDVGLGVGAYRGTAVVPGTPESQNVVDLVPRRARKEYTPNTMYDVLKGFARRVPLPRMIQYEEALRTYIATVAVDAVRQANDTLVIPSDLKYTIVEPQRFEDYKF